MVPLTQIFFAFFALNRGEIKIIFTIGAHIGIIPFVERNDPHITEFTILLYYISYEKKLSVQDAFILLHYLGCSILTF